MIEHPIVEEELVKRPMVPVVKEVLRIRKTTLAEQQSIDGKMQKEHIEVKEEGDTGNQPRV